MQDIKKTYSAFDPLWLFLHKMSKFTYLLMLSVKSTFFEGEVTCFDVVLFITSGSSVNMNVKKKGRRINSNKSIHKARAVTTYLGQIWQTPESAIGLWKLRTAGLTMFVVFNSRSVLIILLCRDKKFHKNHKSWQCQNLLWSFADGCKNVFNSMAYGQYYCKGLAQIWLSILSRLL